MNKVFREIVDRNGKPGRAERFGTIEVHIFDERIDVNWNLLDSRGKKDLRNCAKEVEYEAVSGTAKIAWKSRP